MSDPNAPKPSRRKVPVLAWIIGAILVGVVIYAVAGYGGSRPLPGSDVTMEQPKPDADAAPPPPP